MACFQFRIYFRFAVKGFASWSETCIKLVRLFRASGIDRKSHEETDAVVDIPASLSGL